MFAWFLGTVVGDITTTSHTTLSNNSSSSIISMDTPTPTTSSRINLSNSQSMEPITLRPARGLLLHLLHCHPLQLTMRLLPFPRALNLLLLLPLREVRRIWSNQPMRKLLRIQVMLPPCHHPLSTLQLVLV